MDIQRVTPENPLWSSMVSFLHRVNEARWVLDKQDFPQDGILFLAAAADGEVVGGLTLKQQDIIVPATEWSGNEAHPLTGPDGGVLREAFVQTFHIDEAHQRQGYGRALQAAALEWARELGCYQMRSWSSLDRPANYALKLGMGFAAAPAICETGSGKKISGVYFVMKL